MKKQVKNLQQSLTRWQETHADINSLRNAYQKKILTWVVSSMEFEKEPVSMERLKELHYPAKQRRDDCHED